MKTRASGLQLIVRCRSSRATVGTITYGNLRFPCTIGRSGCSANKREGDGSTPIGVFALRETFYRADRLARPRSHLPLKPLRMADGWCDDPRDRNYNRQVRHPYPASTERMWRDDNLYDVIVVLGHNDLPRVRGRGSAVFMHVARTGMTPTEGCVALRLPHLLRLLVHMSQRNLLRITA
jgi:L,D-peptidoglycan transpeptidase YkuD (ErfK/YbiS/YcfS/YnhG family)